MSSDDENYGGTNPAAHKKLLSDINEIVKFQHIKKPVRSEPALKNSEFHLVKSKSSGNDIEREEKRISKKNVSISSVAQTVQKNTKQKQIAKQLKNAFKNENVLSKPLEKVHAERIQRTVAYDNTKAKLGRWDAVVTKNQNAPQLHFPLQVDKVKIKRTESDVPKFRYKTQMMKDLEEIQNECFPEPLRAEVPEPATELLSLDEMNQRRKELGRLKLRESHKIAKKRQQGKIKSKKYHKLKKRDDLKKKLKEFEELKVTNPELALKELEKIERVRVQERTTLRHKNTGTWAKNLQVRAKYDANVKQDLEAQLALGRELTQKNQKSDSSDSEDEEETVPVVSSENPWLGKNPSADPLDEVFSGYKKFWEQHNEDQKELKRVKRNVEKAKTFEEDEISEPEVEENSENEDEDDEESEVNEGDSDDDENSSKFINDLFDEAEEKIDRKMEARLKDLKPKLMEVEKSKRKKDQKKKRGANVHDANYLGFEKKAKLGDVDEALNEGDDVDVDTSHISSRALLKEIKKKQEEKASFMKGSKDINPDSFLSVKSKHLITAVPRSQDFGEIDEEYDVNQLSKANKLSLAEAFENDDIINDFEKDVEEEDKKIRGPEEVLLPGWGSWGGEGLKSRAHKVNKKNTGIKKKDRVIVSSAVNEKLKKHLISSVPFPFKSIQDFEASMRLPIGRDFIPESAHRKLTMPSVVTKAGTIIEPMSEDVLVQNEPKKRFMKRGVPKKGRKTRK